MIAEDTLDRLAATPRLLVALDFDGTLSPLVEVPMDARMHERARVALDALVAAPDTTVALVSGRSLADLRVIADHDDTSRLILAGSHGVEFWYPDRGRVVPDVEGEQAALHASLIDEAAARIEELPGVSLEPKSYGFSVHSRGAGPAAAAEAERRMDELRAEKAPHWRRRSGHDIVEYSFRDEGKDAAIETLRSLVHPTAVVFAGDDVTDEDAIAALGADDVGIRLGDGESVATVRIPDIVELASWLAELAWRRVIAAEPGPRTADGQE